MNIRAGKDYFLVRINTLDKRQRSEKEGSIYLAQEHIHMTRNMQSGEIIAIGEKAATEFPEAALGDTLLFHHFVENARRHNYLFSDQTYSYYAVRSWGETYGVIRKRDGSIVTHKEYVFLEAEPPERTDLPPDEFINQAMQQTAAGLFVFKAYRESKEHMQERIMELRKQIESLCKSGTYKPHIQKLVAEKEAEIKKIMKERDKKVYEPYVILNFNPKHYVEFDRQLKPGMVGYFLNLGCQTKLMVQEREIIAARSEFFSGALTI